MTLTEEAELLLHRPGAPLKTWTFYGRPELEGQPTLATINGYVVVPPYPPPPGGRSVDGRMHP